MKSQKNKVTVKLSLLNLKEKLSFLRQQIEGVLKIFI